MIVLFCEDSEIQGAIYFCVHLSMKDLYLWQSVYVQCNLDTMFQSEQIFVMF